MEAFVYCWTDHRDQKLYVGSHKGTINDGYVCSSKIMLKEYKERPRDFTRQIIAKGTYEDIVKLEKKILESVNAAFSEEYYNQTNGNGKTFNVPMTEERKRKIGAKLKGHKNCIGRVMTEEAKKKIGTANSGPKPERRGWKHSEEAKEKIGMKTRRYIMSNGPTWLGRKHSKETKKKLSEIAKKRPLTEERLNTLRENAQKMKERGHSEETKRKISLAQKDKIIPREQIEKMIETKKSRHYDYYQSQEYKEKMSNSLKGKTRTPEQRERYRQAALNRKNKK